MIITTNDYIEGTEYYGQSTKKVCGWVYSISNDGEHFIYSIQADDEYKGHRGTMIFSELGRVTKLENKARIDL